MERRDDKDGIRNKQALTNKPNSFLIKQMHKNSPGKSRILKGRRKYGLNLEKVKTKELQKGTPKTTIYSHIGTGLQHTKERERRR
ncbi:hypothetical protein E2C01_028914 [Portunus trituberculatus]|uniref:Uncharacterized protein n=1 Tax=Portunus trituberculatus TaxID=210409 RepID=A0A5B7ELY4_PORTR|nr:hypothetical protein [Portunus trituberculatus]